MLREIKFRGLRADGGGWVYGYYAVFSGRHIIYVGWTAYEVKPESVGQFTGLYDKKGTEIYEGDIVYSFKKEYEDTPSKNIVKLIRGCFRLVCIGKNDIPLYNYSPHDLEIIGNIHQK